MVTRQHWTPLLLTVTLDHIFIWFSNCGLQPIRSWFVMTGQDLRLNVTAPVVLSKRDQFKWTFNNIEVIVTIYADNYTEQDDSYTDRAFISAENKSLLLKNTQNNDSGLYRAELQTRRNKCLVQYQVMVQDMVSRPNLVVTRVSSSSAHCDLNVTCSTADSELITNSVSCNSSDCSLQETETSRDTVSGAVLSLFLSHDNLVVCQLSNNVSQQRVTEEILQLCVTDSDSRFFIIIGSVVGVTVVICLVVIFILFYNKHRPGKRILREGGVNFDSPDENRKQLQMQFFKIKL
uniref:Natural killer cell receptor 2B4 immunoglobulin domain-containing protein n=1 Tax=Cynoglossus semilaevis TaxID=244447 RepID=A0A3P8V6W1_CYNSE